MILRFAGPWVLLFCLVGPLQGICRDTTPGSGPFATLPDDNPSLSGLIPDDASIPGRLIDLMRISQLTYNEGVELIKSGESAKARAAYNKAVDLILGSEWDLRSHPALNIFFQDLIRRIHHDESLYLQPGENLEEDQEKAVVDELEELDLIPITIDPSLQDAVEADLADTRYDIPVMVNEQVLKALNYWLGKGRSQFAEGLVRSGRYLEMIRKTFREQEIPLDIMYMAQVESLFKTSAYSRRYAKGIWQFSSGTAIRYGLKVNSQIDERSDPEKSTVAAAKYLRDLYAMFQDWNLVLAAYNWGEGRVQRLVSRSGINDFWDLLDLKRNFPRETRNHVPLIMASIILAKNPQKYGLPTELDPPLVYDTVPVNKPVDLKLVAAALGTELEELRRLNPELRRGITPSTYPDYRLKVPPDTGPEAETKIAALPQVKPARLTSGGRHKVASGETLSHIASRYGVSVQLLQEFNSITSPRTLRVGTWLTIPQRTKPGAKQTSAASRARGASGQVAQGKTGSKSSP